MMAVLSVSQRQLTLDVGLRDGATFESFEPGRNADAVAVLTAMAAGRGEPQIFLHGAAGCGKSHLLQAACHAATGAAAWLPLRELAHLGPGVLENLETAALVCLDDTDAVLPGAAWEAALFGLINAARARGTRLVFAAGASPVLLGIALPDLVSRLTWGPVFHLQPLDDEGRRAALVRRARARGFELTPETVDYILRRSVRDLPALMDLLDRIDRASLSERRRVTVPFVRELLEND